MALNKLVVWISNVKSQPHLSQLTCYFIVKPFYFNKVKVKVKFPTTVKFTHRKVKGKNAYLWRRKARHQRGPMTAHHLSRKLKHRNLSTWQKKRRFWRSWDPIQALPSVTHFRPRFCRLLSLPVCPMARLKKGGHTGIILPGIAIHCGQCLWVLTFWKNDFYKKDYMNLHLNR